MSAKACCEVAAMFGQVCLDCNPVKRTKAPAVKNLCGKSRARNNPYEVWVSRDGRWTWAVLKKWQADDDKPYARWFCEVKSPFTPEGELGDVYVKEIKDYATRQK